MATQTYAKHFQIYTLILTTLYRRINAYASRQHIRYNILRFRFFVKTTVSFFSARRSTGKNGKKYLPCTPLMTLELSGVHAISIDSITSPAHPAQTTPIQILCPPEKYKLSPGFLNASPSRQSESVITTTYGTSSTGSRFPRLAPIIVK